MPDLALLVNGASYGGWKSVRVVRGIESIAGGFDLSVSDRWADQVQPWPIQEEDECRVLIGGSPLITGYVDRRSISYGPEEHTLRVSGRDKAGALVDCSAVLKSWEFNSTPLLLLATQLCQPFGIPVTMDPGVSGAVTLKTSKTNGSVSGAGRAGKAGGLGVPSPPKKFSVDPGESAFGVLERACRVAGVLPVSDGLGGIRLTRSGSARASTALVEGENILSASADYDASARYARYIVTAQNQGTDEFFGESAASVRGEAQDDEVRRSERVLYIRPESGMTSGAAKNRAAWEAKVRAARGDAISVTVQGWTQADGSLWPVNALVSLRSPLLGMDAELLITQVEYSLDESGTTTRLSLKRPDAFLPEPIVTQPAGLWKEISHGA